MAFIELALKGSPRQALFFATLAFFSGLASVSLFGPTVKLLRESMGLTPLQAGLLVAIPTLSGSLGRIPFGAWVETAGGKKPILCLLSTATLGMAGLLALVATYPEGPPSFYYPAVLFFGFLAGFGIATFSAGAAQVSYWFPRAKQGAALGIYGGLSNLAPGLFAALIPLAVGEWGLTGAYAAWLLYHPSSGYGGVRGRRQGRVLLPVMAGRKWFAKVGGGKDSPAVRAGAFSRR